VFVEIPVNLQLMTGDPGPATPALSGPAGAEVRCTAAAIARAGTAREAAVALHFRRLGRRRCNGPKCRARREARRARVARRCRGERVSRPTIRCTRGSASGALRCPRSRRVRDMRLPARRGYALRRDRDGSYGWIPRGT
jgi:hypothetical protein